MKRGFKKWAEETSEGLRKKLGLLPLAPLHALSLADYLKIDVLTPKEISHLKKETLDQLLQNDRSSWSAVTFRIDGHHIVVYNSSHAPPRVESDLMHEIAHCLCGHEPAQIVRLAGMDIPLRSYNAESEEEARWFGGCLQIPRCALLKCAFSGMEDSEIAVIYYSSTSLVRYRRNVTGVDRQMRRD